MSEFKNQLLTCPYCGAKSEFKIWNNINVILDPELKQDVLNKSVFTFICPHCGRRAKVSYDCLYHDAAQEYMLYLVTSEKSEQDTYQMILDNWSNTMVQQMIQGENYRLRIVHSQNELREKILIFDAGKDDRVIELCKVLSLLNMQAQGMEFTDDVELRYLRVEGKDWLQIVDQKEVKGNVDIPPSMYNSIYYNFSKWLSDAQRDNIFIDHQWAVYVTNENRREQHDINHIMQEIDRNYTSLLSAMKNDHAEHYEETRKAVDSCRKLLSQTLPDNIS